MPELDLEDQRVVVTGGAGFIGRSVMNALATTGANPVAFGLVADGLDRFESIQGDIGDEAALAGALEGATGIVHLAARSGGIQLQTADHDDLFIDNTTMTSAVIAAARQAGIRRIFLASSAVIYGTPIGSEPLTEASPLLTVGDGPTGYAWSKITDEVMARWAHAAGDLDPVIGRFGNVYGPGASFDPSRSTVIHGLIRRAFESRDQGVLSVWGDGSAVRSFIYVDDTAAAVARILAVGSPGESYNVDSGEPVPIGDLAQLVAGTVDPSLRIRFDASQPSGTPYRVGDIGKLATLGHRNRTSLEAGVAATVEAYAASVN